MSPVSKITLLWLAFAGSHLLLSSLTLRPRITGRIGERAFLGLYSLLSLALFVPLVSIYLEHRHEGAFLWTVSMTPAVTWLVYALMTVGVLLVVAGAVGYMVWQDSRTSSIEFSVGDDGVSITES